MPFTLNVAVDHLLKKEFDLHRAQGQAHPLMKEYGIEAVPFDHVKMGEWRHNFTGVQYHHPQSDLLIFGAVDDIWVTPKNELHVVDYKATAKDGEVELTDAEWHNSYRRQMEVYQWLLRHNNFKVSDTGYFVYANGKKDAEAFDGKLEFKVKIIPYKGNDDWVEPTILEIAKCLKKKKEPKSAEGCEFCSYREKATDINTK